MTSPRLQVEARQHFQLKRLVEPRPESVTLPIKDTPAQGFVEKVLDQGMHQ